MENHDKIFDQITKAAQKAERRDFAAMEKVWSRVEDKLAHKEARRSVFYWKSLAIAASLLLVMTLGYEFFKADPKPVTAPQVVATPETTIKTETPFSDKTTQPEAMVVSVVTKVPQIKTEETVYSAPEADAVVSSEIAAQETNYIEEVENPKTILAERQIPNPVAVQEKQTVSGFVSNSDKFLPGVNVVVMGTSRGTKTDSNGKYAIDVEKGEKIVFSFNGMDDAVATVGDKQTINMELQSDADIEKTSKHTKDKNPAESKGKDSFKKNKIGGNSARVSETDKPQPVESPNVEFQSNSPTVYLIDGKPATPDEFRQIKTEDVSNMKLMTQAEASSLYGKKAVNGALIVSKKAAKTSAAWYGEEDEKFVENAFESPAAAPLSTFSVESTNTAYLNIRQLINNKKSVPKEVVRIEDMINFFRYDYPQPQGRDAFTINTEYGNCPWNSRHRLVKIGIQGKNTVQKLAKDVKIQIEFNPAHVQSYRLIGYESRKLQPQDFNANAIDVSELAGGHTVTALYEIIPFGLESPYFSETEGLEYSKVRTGTLFSGELAKIKFRYKNPAEGKGIEMVKTIENKPSLLQNSSEDFRFCAAVAWFGLRLRDSKLVGNKSYDDLIKLAKTSSSNDPQGFKAEFIRLVEAVKKGKRG